MIAIYGKPAKNELLTTDYNTLISKRMDGTILYYAKNVVMRGLFFVKHLGLNYNYHNKSFKEFVDDVLKNYHESEKGKEKKQFYEDCKTYCRNLSKPDTIALYYMALATKDYQFTIEGEAREINMKRTFEGGVDVNELFDEEIPLRRIKGRLMAKSLYEPNESKLKLLLVSKLDELCSLDYKDEIDFFLRKPYETLKEHYDSFIRCVEYEVDESYSSESIYEIAHNYQKEIEDLSEEEMERRLEEEDREERESQEIEAMESFTNLTNRDELIRRTSLPENYPFDKSTQNYLSEWLSY